MQMYFKFIDDELKTAIEVTRSLLMLKLKNVRHYREHLTRRQKLHWQRPSPSSQIGTFQCFLSLSLDITENFTRQKNREDSFGLDENLMDSLAVQKTLI